MVKDELPEELASVFDEINRALDMKLYYLAVVAVLCVPDICACLEFDLGQSKIPTANKETYEKWWDSHGQCV
jgi:hypothetical protein